MNLKKNDKIILIVGVIILVVAAAAIAVYTPEPSEEVIDTSTQKTTFLVTWTEHTEEDTVKGRAEKTYADPISIDSSYGSVLTDVSIDLNWQDDYTYGLLFKKGEDTLTAKITYKGETKRETSVGGGTIEFSSFKINEQPLAESIEANSIIEAEDILDSMISGENKASFDVDITVNTGERLISLRPLRYFRDKGNGFTLEITYHYLDYTLEEQEKEDETGSTTALGNGIGNFYRNLSYGRGWI